MAPRVTAHDIAGSPVKVAHDHPALDRDDECSNCGGRLALAGAVWLADCGRYCSIACLNAHAADLAELMTQRHRDDAAQGGR